MTYDFANLSPPDFEDLVRDLLGRELAIRFEAFAQGPDGGMDGRHAVAGNSVILQAKHYSGSNYAALKAAVTREGAKIEQLAPERYLLATSRALTHKNKAELALLIGPALQSEDDIFSAGDINGLLRKYPEVEKAHIKLWLSGTGVLERILHAANHAYTAIALGEIQAKLRVYAPNPSFPQAREILESHHVAIITGPPGVGKTTLAEMLAYTYLGEGWELVALRSLDDGLAAIKDGESQIFLFDDFLGKVALDARALSSKDSDLVRFMERVRKSPNARFILTTRAYIFEQARQASESLASPSLDVTRYVLDVGVYTRRIKARILYNHLLVSNTLTDHVKTLIESGKIPQILDHSNYSPRVVAWMTDTLRLADVPAATYPDAFLDLLANPKQLWDIPFRQHLPDRCRHLLFALFFCSQYGVEVENLQESFEALHQRLSSEFGTARGPKDFEDALQSLEGGFVALRGDRVDFINPSLRDYLTDYLSDARLLVIFVRAGRRWSWLDNLWRYVLALGLSDATKAGFANEFAGVVSSLMNARVMKPVKDKPGTRSIADRSNADRLTSLLEWWKASSNAQFADLAVAQVVDPVEYFDYWLDGRQLIRLVPELRGPDYDSLPHRDALVAAIEARVVELFEGWMTIDFLEQLTEAVGELGPLLSEPVHAAAREAINLTFQDISPYINDEDSQSTLAEYIKMLEKLRQRADVTFRELEQAVAMINWRIDDLEENPPARSTIDFGEWESENDFSNQELDSLFATLLEVIN